VSDIASIRSIFNNSNAVVRCGGNSSIDRGVLNRANLGCTKCVTALSSGNTRFNGGGEHESVDKIPQLHKPVHRKTRRGYNSNRPCFGKRHPLRDQKLCAIWLTDHKMVGTTMLMVANNQHRLANERVKRVGDCDYRLIIKRQIPGTMSSPWRWMKNST